GFSHGDLDVVRARLPERVLRGEATLEGAAGFERRAVRFVHALAAVVPVPFDLGTVELVDVFAALQLGGEEHVDGGEGHARGRAQVQSRLAGFLRGEAGGG